MMDSIFYLHFLIIIFGPEFFPEYYFKIMNIRIRIFVPIKYVEDYAHEISVPFFFFEKTHLSKKNVSVKMCSGLQSSLKYIWLVWLFESFLC